MPFSLTGVGGATPQGWLGAHYPQLADECDRVPGLASTIADIIEAIEMHAEHYRLDLAEFRPSATITAAGRIVVDLGAPNA